MTWFETVRGVEVEIFADNFEGDPSVGIEYGPEEVYAKTLDGVDFPLTESETETLTIKASQMYYEDFVDDYDS